GPLLFSPPPAPFSSSPRQRAGEGAPALPRRVSPPAAKTGKHEPWRIPAFPGSPGIPGILLQSRRENQPSSRWKPPDPAGAAGVPPGDGHILPGYTAGSSGRGRNGSRFGEGYAGAGRENQRQKRLP